MNKIPSRLRMTFLIGGVVLVLSVFALFSWADIGSSSESDGSLSLELPNPLDVYDPTEAGEPLPRDYRQILERDRFLPVYEPTFASADELNWPEEMLVIGVTGGDEAKAYSVTYLNQREMVIDEIGGTPILVSW